VQFAVPSCPGGGKDVLGGGTKLGAPCGFSCPMVMSYFTVNGFNPGGDGDPELGAVVFEYVVNVPAGGIEYQGVGTTGLLFSATDNF
jgi:hypothetical protein